MHLSNSEEGIKRTTEGYAVLPGSLLVAAFPIKPKQKCSGLVTMTCHLNTFHFVCLSVSLYSIPCTFPLL